jgi:GTP-binding protein
LKISSSRFVRAAYKPEDEPNTPGPDVVFLGRSNVGKSSLINTLLGVKGLARTSSRPGRTQSVNFYRINESCHFVDLPGYGYARVPERVRQNWGPMVEGYLLRRKERIALAMLVVDSRHDASPLDVTMRDWLENQQIEYLIVATKADKLSGNGRAKAKKMLKEQLDGTPLAEPILYSATTGLGMKPVWRFLDRALAPEKDRT